MCPICGRVECDCSPFEKAASRPFIDLRSRGNCCICGRTNEGYDSCTHDEQEQRKYAKERSAEKKNADGYVLDTTTTCTYYPNFGRIVDLKSAAALGRDYLKGPRQRVVKNEQSPAKFRIKDLKLIPLPLIRKGDLKTVLQETSGLGALGVNHALKLLEDDGCFIPGGWGIYELVFSGTLYFDDGSLKSPVLCEKEGRYIRTGDWSGMATHEWNWEISFLQYSLLPDEPMRDKIYNNTTRRQRRVVVWRPPKS
jgi:hypothetical protein